MSLGRSWIASGCALSATFAALAIPAASGRATITRASARVDESQRDGFAQESFTLNLSKDAEPIKSLSLGPPSGLQYGPVSKGLQVLTAGKPARYTAKHVENTIVISFSQPVTSVSIRITSPAIHNCTAGIVTPLAAVGATGFDAGKGTIAPRAVTVRFINVRPPTWWHPNHKAQLGVC